MLRHRGCVVLNSDLEEEGEHGGEPPAAWKGGDSKCQSPSESTGVRAAGQGEECSRAPSHWLGSCCIAVLEEATRGQQIPYTEVTDSCELPSECWESNLAPLEVSAFHC